jgi:hypothetical protein
MDVTISFIEMHCSEQMMVMLDDPDLLQLATKRYPMPTVVNPNPTPLEIIYLEDLEAVHGADNALFIMNQLGQLLTGGEGDDIVQFEWSPEHMDKLMGEEEIDELEPVDETGLMLSRRHTIAPVSAATSIHNMDNPSTFGAVDEDVVTERLKLLMNQNQQLSSSLALLSNHVQNLQSGQSLIPGIPDYAEGRESKSGGNAGNLRAPEEDARSPSLALERANNEQALRRWIKLVARMTAPEFDLD